MWTAARQSAARGRVVQQCVLYCRRGGPRPGREHAMPVWVYVWKDARVDCGRTLLRSLLHREQACRSQITSWRNNSPSQNCNFVVPPCNLAIFKPHLPPFPIVPLACPYAIRCYGCHCCMRATFSTSLLSVGSRTFCPFLYLNPSSLRSILQSFFSN